MHKGYTLPAGALFLRAKAAYEATNDAGDEREPRQEAAIDAIVFSEASLEGFINELAFLAKSLSVTKAAPSTDQAAKLATLADLLLEAESNNANVRFKYIVAKWVLSGQGFDKGKQPYQDFALLIDTRNVLLHLRPVEMHLRTNEELTDGLLKRFASKNVLAKSNENVVMGWLERIKTRAVARWACNTTSRMVLSIVDATKIDALKLIFDLSYREKFSQVQ
ncbi:MAG: hypothetical protein V3T84_06555 [Phycisphaerales bacterium]